MEGGRIKTGRFGADKLEYERALPIVLMAVSRHNSELAFWQAQWVFFSPKFFSASMAVCVDSAVTENTHTFHC